MAGAGADERLIALEPRLSGARTLLAASVAMLASFPLYMLIMVLGASLTGLGGGGDPSLRPGQLLLLLPTLVLFSFLGAFAYPKATALAFILIIVLGRLLIRRRVDDGRAWNAAGAALGFVVAVAMFLEERLGLGFGLDWHSLLTGAITGAIVIQIFRWCLLRLSRGSGYRAAA